YPLHPLNALDQFLMHHVGGFVASPAVAGKHPFESVVEKAFHGLCLFAPRVPADITKGFQSIVFVSEVISRKEVLVAIQQRRMSPRMAGSRDNEKICIEFGRFLTFNRSLDADMASVRTMNEPLAAEVLPEFFMVGDIVAVSEKHG